MNNFNRIGKLLEHPLPGIKAQQLMAPEGRPLYDDGSFKRNAAVSIILVKETDPEIILIKRQKYDGHHSGQISFPGGKQEACDENLLETSIRETFEEIGIKLAQEDVLGELSPLQIPVSGFIVKPYVFKYTGTLNFSPDKHEVNYVIVAPVRDFLNSKNVKTKNIEVLDGKLEVPYYDIRNETIWGATAMILSELIEILQQNVY